MIARQGRINFGKLNFFEFHRTDFQLPTANCKLPTADYRLFISRKLKVPPIVAIVGPNIKPIIEKGKNGSARQTEYTMPIPQA